MNDPHVEQYRIHLESFGDHYLQLAKEKKVPNVSLDCDA